MFKKIKQHIKNNHGDMYIQMLICMFCLLGILVFAFQITTVLTEKIWIDDQLNDVVRVIAVTGDTNSDEVDDLISGITDRMGGTVEVVPDGEFFDESDGTVQLGTTVRVHYLNEDFPIINLGDFAIGIEVDLERQGITEVYFKPVS